MRTRTFASEVYWPLPVVILFIMNALLHYFSPFKVLTHSISICNYAQQKTRKMKRNGRTKKNREKQLCIRLFSYLFCWFWVFSCLFTAVKEIKQININGCDIAIEWLKIDKIYYALHFSFHFFILSLFLIIFFFMIFIFFNDLFAIDCGFSRSTSVSTILFFFMLFGIHFFFIYFNKWLIFFCDVILELWYESEACLVCV